MSGNYSVAKAVKDNLKNREPLEVLFLKDLYSCIDGNDNAIRAALYGSTIGSKVSKNDSSRKYYAIKLKLPLASGDSTDIYLSLPGIPRELIEMDASKDSVQNIISSLQEIHGQEVIDYWGRSAQYRSVDLARKSMDEARDRNGGRCRICLIPGVKMGDFTIRASHVISRRLIFWLELQEVQIKYGTIFSNEAVQELKSKIESNPYHSDSQFIIPLCTTHDNLLRSTLKWNSSDA